MAAQIISQGHHKSKEKAPRRNLQKKHDLGLKRCLCRKTKTLDQSSPSDQNQYSNNP
jgi:hypothetical protein